MRPFPEIEECPGYATSLPDVIEIARAMHWRDKGQLQLIYPRGLTPALCDGIDILSGSVREQEASSVRRRREESSRG